MKRKQSAQNWGVTTVPYSELAMWARIAGKKGRIIKIEGNLATVEVEGKEFTALPCELIDIEDRGGET